MHRYANGHGQQGHSLKRFRHAALWVPSNKFIIVLNKLRNRINSVYETVVQAFMCQISI